MKTLLHSVEGAIIGGSRVKFKDWIANSLKVGVGALHRFSKQHGQSRASLAEVYTDDGEKTIDAQQAVDAKAVFWGDLWRAERRPPPPAP